MDMFDKLKILTDAAKYDVACTSSGVDRSGNPGSIGSAAACGICHTFAADGRCVSLLKILQTNNCMYDCKYCINRSSNDVPRTSFTPDEIGELTINFYKRNYIEGLFLSSAVFKSPDHTMETLCQTLYLVRTKYRFGGYIHVKAIPGADDALITKAGLLADRMSVNIEMPSHDSLKFLAPDKKKEDILRPMRFLAGGIAQSKNELTIYKHAKSFVPAGQSTQMVIGATPDSDRKIVALSESLYKTYGLKRVFYSAYNPVGSSKFIPDVNPPLLREHRLYQADWLMRVYGFDSGELFSGNENLSLNMDPKCAWARRHIEKFPVEINRADKETLLRVPGIGETSVYRILKARRVSRLNFDNLKKIGVVLKRAKYFITCEGKMYEKINLDSDILTMRLSENKISEAYDQLSIFDTTKKQALLTQAPPTPEDMQKCVTGQL
jgi:putative DNA modification/repair radical SAM protein